MSHSSGGSGPAGPHPPPPHRPQRPVHVSSSSAAALPSPSLRRWNTQLQTQIAAKCCSKHGEQALAVEATAAAASPSPIAASSAGACAALAAASSAAFSAASLTAVSHSPTFLHLIHAIQSTHPQRRSHSVTATPATPQQQPQSQLPISTAASFFPLHSGLPTLLALLQQRSSSTGNLYRTWSGTNAGAAAAASSAAQHSHTLGVAGSSRSRASSQSTPRFSDDLLFARLVSRPSAAHASRGVAAEAGQLYLEDQSACVPAIVLGADVSLLGRWCLFPIWTLLIVPHAARGHANTVPLPPPQGVFEIQAQDAIPIPALNLHAAASSAPQLTPTPPTAAATSSKPDRAAASLAWSAFAHPPSIVQASQCHPLAFSEAARMFDQKPANDVNACAAASAASAAPAAAAKRETSVAVAPGSSPAVALKREPEWEERKMSDVPPSDALSASGAIAAAAFGATSAVAPSSAPFSTPLVPRASAARPRRPRYIPLRPPPAMIDDEDEDDAIGEERKEAPVSLLDALPAPAPASSITTMHDVARFAATVSLSLTPAATPRPLHAGKRKSHEQQLQPPLHATASVDPAPPTPAAIRSTLPTTAAPAVAASHDVKRQKLHASVPAAAAATADIAAAPAAKRPPSVFHLRGTIQSISPIIQRDAAMFFFIDLRELATDAGSSSSGAEGAASPAAAAVPLSTVLLFTGASAVRWYSFLRVGSSYLFTRLRVSTVLRDASTLGRMVCANTFAVEKQQPPQSRPQQQEDDCPFESKAKQTLIFPIKHEPAPKRSSPLESPSPDAVKMDVAAPSAAAAQSRPPSPPPSTSGSLSMPFLISTPPSTASSAASSAAAPVAIRAAPRSPPAPPPSTLSYTGTITAIPTWGVFDLDGDDVSGSGSGGGQRCFVHPLAFVASSGSAGGTSLMLRMGVGLRVGARVTLHHVHPLVQRNTRLGFLCCFASQIELVALSPSDRLADAFDARRAQWYTALWQRYAARDVALMLSLFLEARRKFGAILSSRKMLEAPSSSDTKANNAPPSTAVEGAAGGWILRLLSPLLSSRAGCPMDEAKLKAVSLEMYEQFFTHADGAACSMVLAASSPLALQQQRALPFPVLLPLADLLRLRAVCRCAEQLAPKSIQSPSSPSTASASPPPAARVRAPLHLDWSYRFVHSRVIAEMHPQVVLAGVLQSSLAAPRALGGASEGASAASAGPSSSLTSPMLRCAMQLADRSGSVDCVVLGELLPSHINAVLHIRSFAIVMELSPATAVVAASGPDTAAVALPGVVSVLVFDIKDAVIVQPAAMVTRVATPAAAASVARAAAAPAPAAATAARWFYLLHKSDSIVRPSLSTAASSSSAAVPHGLLSFKSSQPKLSAASFQPTLHTQLEVLIRDGTESAASFRPATLRVEGAAQQQLFPFLPLHRAMQIDGVEAVSNEVGQPPCFRLTPASRLLSVQPLPWSLQVRVLDVRDVLVCPVPRVPVPLTGLEIDRVTFRGIVLEKQFREASVSDRSAGGASAAVPPMRRWWLNVRDVSLLHTISVHLDVSSRLLPGSLVPGCVVSFHRLSRMLSARFTIYAEAGGDSFVNVEACVGLEAGGEAMHQDGEEPGTEGGRRSLRVALHTHYPVRALPDTLLSSLSPFAPVLSMRTLSLRVRVVLLKKLVLRWFCSGCGRALLPGAGRCVSRPSSHLGGGLIPACDPSVSSLSCFLESTLVVDDGSAVAMLFVEGDLVWEMLGLGWGKRAQLEEISRERGVLEYFHMSRAAQAQADDDSGGAASAASSSLLVSQRDLRCFQLSLWERHFRESYPGRQLSLKAHQFFMRNVILQTMARRTKAERGAGAGAAAAAAVTGTTAGTSAATVSPLSPSAAAPSAAAASPAASSIPFDACHTRKIIVGPKLQLPTLQAPPITLRAVAIEPVNCRAEASRLLWLFKQGASSS